VKLTKFESCSPLDEESSKIISIWIEKNTILEKVHLKCMNFDHFLRSLGFIQKQHIGSHF
jgi:hypothetical protein